MLPNFLFIGPDKTGSSWIYEILRAHPDCFVPDIKDIYFFDRYYSRGLAWYAHFFSGAPASAVAIGELSHDYLFSAAAAARIARDLPDVKLLTSLRDPVARTFSHYLYLARTGLTRAPFNEALDEFPELMRNSEYALHLTSYYERFSRDQIKVLRFDDLSADARGFGAEILSFLGLRIISDLPYEEVVLPASRARSALLAKLAKSGANAARQLGFSSLVGSVKRSRAASLLYRPFTPEERPRLTRAQELELWERFAPGVHTLTELTGCDFSAWAKKYAAGAP